MISKAFRAGYTIDQVHELTKIDKWFLQKLMNIMQTSKELRQLTIENGQLTMKKEVLATKDPQGNCQLSFVNCQLRKAKQQGFSDFQIAVLSVMKVIWKMEVCMSASIVRLLVSFRW